MLAIGPFDGVCRKSHYGIYNAAPERSLRPQARFGGQPPKAALRPEIDRSLQSIL